VVTLDGGFFPGIQPHGDSGKGLARGQRVSPRREAGHRRNRKQSPQEGPEKADFGRIGCCVFLVCGG
jgi:hypothetical protein